MAAARCAALLLGLLAVTSIATPLTKYELTSVNNQALCNDGSPGAYYFRAGTGQGAQRWVIRLQGGAWCWDKPSCNQRKIDFPFWVTSTMCPPQLEDNQTISFVGHEGILSSDPAQNPYFYNANHVWMWYCSSDSHIGNISAATSMNGWHFRGKVIVQSLILDLLSTRGLKSASQILLTGDSAGGVGTFSNADFVWDIIKQQNPHALYKVWVDAGWFLDIPSYNNPQFNYFQTVARSLYSNCNAIYNENCLNAVGPGKEWQCFHAQYAWSYIKAPVFYQQFQYDSANLGYDGVPSSWNVTITAYVEKFRTSLVKFISEVPALFLPNCHQHESEDQLKFTRVKVLNVTMTDALWKWFVDPAPKPVSYIDDCSGISCNPTCTP